MWNTGCNSWYLTEDGAVDLWPFDLKTMRRLLATPDTGDYHITTADSAPRLGLDKVNANTDDTVY